MHILLILLLLLILLILLIPEVAVGNNDRRQWNMVNIATILHRTGKARAQVPAEITCYLLGKLQELDHREKIGAQAVGNALFARQVAL